MWIKTLTWYYLQEAWHVFGSSGTDQQGQQLFLASHPAKRNKNCQYPWMIDQLTCTFFLLDMWMNQETQVTEKFLNSNQILSHSQAPKKKKMNSEQNSIWAQIKQTRNMTETITNYRLLKEALLEYYITKQTKLTGKRPIIKEGTIHILHISPSMRNEFLLRL